MGAGGPYDNGHFSVGSAPQVFDEEGQGPALTQDRQVVEVGRRG